MEFIHFTVAERDFSAAPMDAFTIASMWPKFIKKLGSGISAESDVVQALGNLDEEALNNLIFPMLKKSAVTCVSESKKLSTPSDFNVLFDHKNLFDFYLVVWEVIKLNFAPLLNGLLSQFGLSLTDLEQRVKTQLNREENPPESSETM